MKVGFRNNNLILNIPHSSTWIPDDSRKAFVVDDRELRNELLVMTDWYTDELFDHRIGNAVIAPVSRLVCDTERFSHNAMEPMSKRGMGFCYTHGSRKQIIKMIDSAYSDEILWRYYAPHHIALTDAVETAIRKTGSALVLDCHSFSSHPLPYEPEQGKSRPDICIGTDGFHTSEDLEASAVDFYKSKGFRVKVNNPYSGSIVPLRYYGKDKRVSGIMVEVNRSLYMDEKTGRKRRRFDDIKEVIKEFEATIAMPENNYCGNMVRG